MQSSTPEDNFSIACSYLGWGDPSGGFWFIGIEESDVWTPEQLVQKEAIEQDASGARYEIPDFDGKSWKSWSEGRGKGQILPYTAKICTACSKRFGDWERDWRIYKEKCLFRRGSKVFFTNLFPIGRQNTAIKHDDLQKELFGAAVEHESSYMERVAKIRFPIMKACWARWKPLATICFVGAYQKYVPDALGISRDWRKFGSDGELHHHVSERVIMTPHFSRPPMSDNKARTIIDKLKDWGAELP
jgi:hypothetical protein